jgi:hypothetical protein
VEGYVLLHRDTGLLRHRVQATAREAAEANQRLAAAGSRLRFVVERLTVHVTEREQEDGM